MSLATPPSPILVVGAGPTGLMMASELARHGAPCRVIDRSPHATTESRAVGIHARTLEVFDDLGVAEAFLAAGLKVHGLNLYGDGRRLVHLSLDELHSPYPFVLDLPQSDTERLLAEHLARFGVRVEREVELTAMEQDAGGVSATLRRADGNEEQVRTPWIVGCDGAHSTVRHAVGMPFEGATYDECWGLADVKVQWDLPHDEMHVFFTEDGLLAAFPLPGDRWRLIAETHAAGEPGALPAPTAEEFQEQLARRGPKGAALSDPIWLAAFRIHHRKAAHYRSGRAFIAGDAMHIHSPAGGQGMNTGLQDAYNLAWKLALVQAGRAPVSLLDSYDAERLPVATTLLKMTDAATKIGTLRNPVTEVIRNRVYPFLAQQEVVQQRIATRVAELDINYRRSPIVAEHLGGFHLPFAGVGPRAGDRAPDAGPLRLPDGTTGRLFDALRGTQHVALLFPGRGDGLDALAEIAAPYADVLRVFRIAENGGRDAELRDAEGAVRQRYAGDAACLYVIRPDGYVGFRSVPPDAGALHGWLARVFG